MGSLGCMVHTDDEDFEQWDTDRTNRVQLNLSYTGRQIRKITLTTDPVLGEQLKKDDNRKMSTRKGNS